MNIVITVYAYRLHLNLQLELVQSQTPCKLNTMQAAGGTTVCTECV